MCEWSFEITGILMEYIEMGSSIKPRYSQGKLLKSVNFKNTPLKSDGKKGTMKYF
jgi:hypothetical protein